MTVACPILREISNPNAPVESIIMRTINASHLTVPIFLRFRTI